MGVLALTLLIASVSLLVAHVFQTVVDLQVKQVRARLQSLPMGLFPLKITLGSRGREDGDGGVAPYSSLVPKRGRVRTMHLSATKRLVLYGRGGARVGLHEIRQYE